MAASLKAHALLMMLLMLAKYPRFTISFIPDALAGISSPGSTFHTEMTHKAILRHIMEFFDDYRPKGAQPLEKLVGYDPSSEEIFRAFYGDDFEADAFNDALDQLKDACASVDHDKETKSNPKWHFDAEQFEDGKNNLLGNMRSVITYIKAGEYETARETLGRMFHPLQDFYSHTNYVESGYSEIMPELISEEKPIPIRTARPYEATCRDCTRDFSDRLKSGLLKLTLIAPLGLGAVGGDEDNIYECINNVIKDDFLTSGYYVNQKDDFGQEVLKPDGVGKCSHGGALDGTSGEYATGGINKDMENSLFAPHDYLHKDAAKLGEEATLHLLNTLREKLSDDTAWGRLLQLGPGPSLAFVIDLCPQMAPFFDTIKAKITEAVVKNSANSVTDRQFIIVPFTDKVVGEPDIGTSEEDLQKAIERTFNFYEQARCGPTRKLYEATQKAALKSNVGGYIYATTEGRAGDSHLAPWVESTLTQKQLTYQLVLANQFPAPRALDQTTNASKPSGAIPQGNVDLVSSSLRKMALTNAGEVIYAGSGDYSTILNYKRQERAGRTVLMIASGKESAQFITILDDTIIELEVSISTNGQGHPPNIRLKDPDGNAAVSQKSEQVDEEEQQKSHYHVIRVSEPKSGSWTINVKADEARSSTSKYTMIVSAASSLTLRTKFLQEIMDEPSAHPGAQGIGRTQPIVGSQLLVSIDENGKEATAVPISVQLRSDQWKKIDQSSAHRSPARKRGYHAQITVPSEPFYIRIYGFNKNGEPFVRTNPRIVAPSTVSLEASSSPKPVTGSSTDFKIPFSITNHGSTALFSVRVYDDKNLVQNYSPKGAILRSGQTTNGHVIISKPLGSQALVTDLAIVASTGKSENSNAVSKFIPLA